MLGTVCIYRTPSETLKSAARSTPCSVQHGANVVHPLLHYWKVVDRDPVREASTALVEHDPVPRYRT
jgi:hypothetical protein